MKHLFLIACFTCLGKYQTTGALISSMKIIKTDFAITTVVNVSCDRFLKEFFHLDTFYIYDSKQQKKILNFIHKSKVTKEYSNPDTRAKMYIYYTSGKVDSLCFGNTIVFSLNNTTMLLPNRDLVIMLDLLKK